MAKSRSEIQKAYRERQKAKGSAFLEKERARQRKNYVPAAQLNRKKLDVRNSRNKLRNRLSRLRHRELQENNNIPTENTSGYETLNTASEHDNGQHSESGPSTPFSNKLVVKLPITGKGLKKVNARALSRANRTIGTLKAEVMKLRRKIKTRNKKIERISKKTKLHQAKAGQLTPKGKTQVDLETLDLTPTRKRIAKRQLLTSNVLMHEIHEAKKASGLKKTSSIHRIISGKVAKKYRCLKSISSGTGVSRRSLAHTYDKDVTVRKEQRMSLSKIAEKSVVDFLNRDDNSRTQPGKSDAKKVENKEEKQQTKVLTDYLRGLHDKYTAEYPENKMSLSTFARLRPTNVLLASFISRNTCQCLHHQNMALKVNSLRAAGVRISENPENIIIHKEDLEQLVQNLPEKMVYKVWQKVDIGNGKKKMKIVVHEDNKQKFKEDLAKQIDMFDHHVQRVRDQYQQVRLLKENLPENEVMMQMDFAENYSCRSLDEVQSAYWNQTMVTIHPAVAYYKENDMLKHKSYVVVSDEMAHSSSTVCAILDKIIPELKVLKPDLRFIHYWTDSPSSQYRNSFMFHTIAQHNVLYNLGARWNYFEVGHGKGPCDGLGGTTKRMADMAIRQGHVEVQNAEDFFKWGTSSSLSAKFLYVSTEETKRKQIEMNMIKTKPLKGTMQLHAVGVTSDAGVIMTRTTSCHCPVCLSGSYCDTWKRQEFRCVTDTATNDTTPAITVEPTDQIESSSTIDNTGDSDNTTAAGSTNEKSSLRDEIEVGSLVAVTYERAWYIGEVVEIDKEDNDYQINFMSKAKEMFKWPQPKDSAWRDIEEILCVVKSLEPSGKSRRLFKISPEEKGKIEDLFNCLV